MNTLLKTAIASVSVIGAINAADVVVQDGTITSGMVYNMTNNNTYYLDGFVYVDSGATLNIQEGTVIRGLGGFGMSVSCLVICRNATINAVGTAEKPIIFTTNSDDLSDPDDFGPNARGLWGGVVILGNGRMVSGTPSLPAGMMRMEGLPEDSTIKADPRNWAGGTDDSDSSGVMKYVSIRHAGSAVSTGNELNGLSMYGVGSRTILEHLEVYANDDDGFEWFGGAVNLKWATVAFCNDDSYDWDNGWDGKGQFWFAISKPSVTIMGHSDRGLEASGTAKVDHNDSIPASNPTVYNFTFIGMGKNASVPSTHSNAIRFNEDSRGKLHNGIITDFPKRAIQFTNHYTSGDSRQHFWNGNLQVTNCFFYDFGAGDTWNTICNNTDSTSLAILSSNNWIKNPKIRGISRTAGQPWLDPRPDFLGSPACSASYVRPVPSGDSFFSSVTYVGAFNRTYSSMGWMQGWTGLSSNKVLSKALKITPTGYECMRSGIDMDLSFILSIPGAEAGVVSTAACTIYVDGTNVSSAFAARATPFTMPNGNGVTFRVNDLQAYELGATGVHTIRAALPLTNGTVVRDTATFRTY